MSQTANSNQNFRVNDSLARQYLNRYEDVKFSSSTAYTYDSILNEFVLWLHDNDLTVLTATNEDVVAYIEACVQRGNRRSTLSSKLSTVTELCRFIHLRTEAKEDLTIDPLQLREIDLGDYKTPPKIERENLTRAELRRLFDAFDSYRNRLMAIVGVETGIRNSDIRELRLQDVRGDHIHVQNPKGSRPYDVPISEQLQFEMDYWDRNVRNGYTYAQQSEYVFPSQNGDKLTSNGSLTKIVKKAASRAGLQRPIGTSELDPKYVEAQGLNKSYREWHRVTPHTLRHSFITLLQEDGVNLTYRMLVSNHRDATTNLGYTHQGNDVVEYIRSRFEPPR